MTCLFRKHLDSKLYHLIIEQVMRRMQLFKFAKCQLGCPPKLKIKKHPKSKTRIQLKMLSQPDKPCLFLIKAIVTLFLYYFSKQGNRHCMLNTNLILFYNAKHNQLTSRRTKETIGTISFS